ncbi:hypothetical protein M5689_022988 [Euphorbia peplus]|nr:hypothetical protein M5689_022988 [Euphorbia peplus]
MSLSCILMFLSLLLLQPYKPVGQKFEIDSSPPSCENKCQGCTPCTRVSVPVPPSRNFEPNDESGNVVWKCSCGGHLYNPGSIVNKLEIDSSPPTCENKCQGCTPCTRVAAPVPPSFHSEPNDESGNVVWKCSCGGHLYNPGSIVNKLEIDSSPPTCENKCQGCTPCTRVAAPVPPSFHSEPNDESGSVVWKCSCGGHLYNPGSTVNK